MKAVVWTMENCPNCAEVKKVLKDKGVDVEERVAEGLLNGDEFNPQAVKHFAAQGFMAPLVSLDEKFIKADELNKALEGQHE